MMPKPPALYQCTIPRTLPHGPHAGESQPIALCFTPEQLRQIVEVLGRLLALHEEETR